MTVYRGLVKRIRHIAGHFRYSHSSYTDSDAAKTVSSISQTSWKNETLTNDAYALEQYTQETQLSQRYRATLYVIWSQDSLGQLTSTDLVSAKEKTKVSWLISIHSLIRQCFNILIWLVNPSRIRNIKIERSKQLYHNNTLPSFSPLPKLGQWCDVNWLRDSWPHVRYLVRLWW